MTKPKTKPASPWQPGSTAPKDGKPFVCLDKVDDFGLISANGYVPATVIWSGNGFIAFPFRSLAQFFPVYWMPIPPLPEGER